MRQQYRRRCNRQKRRWYGVVGLGCLTGLLILLQHDAHVAGGRHAGFGKWWDSVFTTAGLYYRSQRSKFLEAAQAAPIFWGWQPDLGGRGEDATWGGPGKQPFLRERLAAGMPIKYDEMVTRRFRAMAQKKQRYGRSDALVEQDKCTMYDFLQLNAVPTPPVLGLWRNDTALLTEVESGMAFAKVEKWPVFLKCCHLTQGSANSVLRIKSRQWATENLPALSQFIREKFHQRAHDHGRPWVKYGDVLSAAARPGFIMQGPAPLTHHDEDGVDRIFEMKTHTYWGVRSCRCVPNLSCTRGAQMIWLGYSLM
jgi:hypothetical protein